MFTRLADNKKLVTSVEETEKLGVELGRLLVPGDLVILAGELAAGKTAFTRGIARGAGLQDRVTSPTFALAQLYNQATGNLPQLTHIDVYRLNSVDELEILDVETALRRGAVVIEWGKDFADQLADHYLLVNFQLVANQESQRLITWRWM